MENAYFHYVIYAKGEERNQEIIDIYKDRFLSLAKRLKERKIRGAEEFLEARNYSNRFFQNYCPTERPNKKLNFLWLTLGLILFMSILIGTILFPIFALTLTPILALILTFSLGFGIGTVVGLILGIVIHNKINPPLESFSVNQEIIKESQLLVIITKPLKIFPLKA